MTRFACREQASQGARPSSGNDDARQATCPPANVARPLPIAVAAMDYSAHDPDHPAGGDPWASSPQHNRSSFGQPPTSDIPSSPLPPHASPYGQDSENYGYMGDQSAHNRPHTASENGDSARPQSQAPRQDGQAAQQQHQAPAQGQPGHSQPQRYHGNRPQKPQTQYKLQAKVTGLERTGKKDPILRFDVYVRHRRARAHGPCVRLWTVADAP
jgi:hypothetical protein